MEIPLYITRWFEQKNWKIRPYQQEMVKSYFARQAALLMAPTGGGKTLSGFLGPLIDIHENRPKGIHTIYISPLKALTHDIERNLLKPVEEMGLKIDIQSRTGDTKQSARARMRRKPPNILLTTPESLMLMLSYTDARDIFKNLRSIIIDEVHSFASTKRGDFTALAMARLRAISPQHRVYALSATVAEPDRFAEWLGGNVKLIHAKTNVKPEVEILKTEASMPYSGFMVAYAVKEIYEQITKARTSIIFVNTRSQAEFMFQMLWEINDAALPIAIYHGSLSRENRQKAERLMSEGKLRSVVATAALELGIDWGQVDLVIQVGAPKGVSRLLQRIGRSNHRMDEPSRALLVPSNRFEVLECVSAIRAISKGQLDGEPFRPGSLDVVIQYIINCACSEPLEPEEIYKQIISSQPYANMKRDIFEKLFRFAVDGGYVLRAYDRYKRLKQNENGQYEIANKMVASRHRQNIGTIVEAARLKVKRLSKNGKTGRIIGEVEESFVSQLAPGDSFSFAGEILEYVRVRDMFVEAKPTAATKPKFPTYAGGNMPLSTFLAEGVKDIFTDEKKWKLLPNEVSQLLKIQEKLSVIPNCDQILVESFPRHKLFFLVIYGFEGRRAHQTLGILATRRLERLKLRPLSFTVTDYGLAITLAKQVREEHMEYIFSPEIILDEYEEWITLSPMVKRSFRKVATITGLTEQRYHGTNKTMHQMSFSTDLIYEVLLKHEPDHILLSIAREDAEQELMDLQRLGDLLYKFKDKMLFKELERPSPISIPVIYDVRTERVHGSGAEELLANLKAEQEAETAMDEIYASVKK